MKPLGYAFAFWCWNRLHFTGQPAWFAQHFRESRLMWFAEMQS